MESLQLLENEQKRNALYAAFRNRATNPVDYDFKMSFWKRAIIHVAKASGTSSITLNSLEQKFCKNGKKPLCMGKVLDQMWRDGDIQTRSDYNYSHGGWLLWGFHTFLQRPARWGLSWISHVATPDFSNTEFVINSALEGQEQKILDRHYDHVRHELVDDVVELKDLFYQCKDIVNNETDLLNLLQTLQKQQKLVIQKNVDSIGTVIKFSHRHAHSGKLEVSQVDIGILKLRRTISTVQQHVDNMSEEVDTLITQTRQLIRAQNKTMAKNILKRKKKLEAQIDKKMLTLETLTSLLHQLENAESDAMVFQCYKTGVESLKEANSNVSRDKLNDTFDAMHEVFEDHEEISSLISSPLSDGGVSQSDLEEELEGLVSPRSVSAPGPESRPVGFTHESRPVGFTHESRPVGFTHESRPVGFTHDHSIPEADLLDELDRLEVAAHSPAPARQGDITSTPLSSHR